MRGLLIIFLLCVVCICAGCSFATDFVVLNRSDQPLLVRYTIIESSFDPRRLTMPGTPAVLDFAELRGRDWRLLAKNQYSVDPPTRTVSVTLPPNEALLIDRGGELRSNSDCAGGFDIERIEFIGVKGGVVVEGANFCKSFVVIPKPFYAFGPPTQMVLTYE